jgi:hypothetical protein
VCIRALLRNLAVADSLAVWLSACGVAPRKTVIEPQPPAQKESGELTPPPTPVAALKQRAHDEQQAGWLAQAAATAERALRIRPNDLRLWQILARIQLAQGDATQAEVLAAKSNSMAGNAVLHKQNAHIIAQARRLSNDTKARVAHTAFGTTAHCEYYHTY